MRKRVQEDDAQKQTKIKIWMHLLQNISLDNIRFVHGFPHLRIHKKQDDLTSFLY